MTFAADVRGAVALAASLYSGTPGEPTVSDVRARLDAPLRVAIAGRVKAGKSTLLNALVGEELAPTDAGECTRVVWWFHDGLTYRVTLHPRPGAADPPRPLRFTREDGALEVDLGGTDPAAVDRLDVEWPSPALRTVTLIDTPGIASATPELGDTARRFLAPDDDRATAADAVVYLLRHLHPTDVHFLDAFHDDEHAHATPVNTIAVLSRADELGVGRLDAMDSAARVADRYRRDRRLGRLAQAVVPVAGLLAQAGATLREHEFRALHQLAALPAQERDELLLSVDRFRLRPAPVPEAERAALLDRLGVFGVRLSLQLAATGQAPTATALATALLAASGVHQLQGLLATQFAARRDLLKGRAALAALAALAQHQPVPGADALHAELERIQAGAHELAEVRLLNALRTGDVALPGALAAADTDDALRLLGSDGDTPRARLGLPAEATDADTRAALLDALARWQRRAENPFASTVAVEAARVLVRTCEGLLNAASAPAPPPR